MLVDQPANAGCEPANDGVTANAGREPAKPGCEPAIAVKFV